MFAKQAYVFTIWSRLMGYFISNVGLCFKKQAYLEYVYILNEWIYYYVHFIFIKYYVQYVFITIVYNTTFKVFKK